MTTTATTPPADGQTATETGDTTGAEDSFERAFAEFAGGSTDTAADAGGDAHPEPPGTADAASTGGGQQPASSSTGATATSGIERGDGTQATQPQGGGQGAGDDIWSTASEQQRAAYQAAQQKLQRLDHDSRSNRGRVSSLQREVDTLKAQLAAHKKGAAGSTGQDQDTSDADIRRLQEEYPEVARPVLKELSSLRTQLSQALTRLDQRDSTEAQRDRDQALDREEQALTQMHPDWMQVTGNPAFSKWLETQPRYVVEAIRRNGEAIQDAAEAGDIITRFKAHQGVGAATAAPSASGAMATGAPANLAARRQRQLESGAAVTSRGAGPAGGPPDDFEAAFDYYAKRGR